MKLGLAPALALAVALGASACGGSSASDAPAGPVTFEAELASEGALVFLRGRTDGQRVFAEVVARGVPDLHGIAFRVSWDPEALGLVEATASGVWAKSAVLRAKEASPGQLVVAWSEKGESAGHDASAPLVLGTLVFEAKGHKGTPLAFRSGRSAVMNHAGKPVAVAWRAGTVPAH